MITYPCVCGKQYTMSDDKAGAKVRCPACGAVGEVPPVSGPEQSGDPVANSVPTLPLASSPNPPTAPAAPPSRSAPESLVPMLLAGLAFGAVCLVVFGLHLVTRTAKKWTGRVSTAIQATTQEGADGSRQQQSAAGNSGEHKPSVSPPPSLPAELPEGDRLKAGLQTKSMDPAELFRVASPAVVRVEVYDRDFRPAGQGSGFLVSEDGLIATNYHVIENAQFATAVLSNELKCLVEGVVAWDRSADLALLKIQGKKLPFLDASARDLPEVGAKVYAIGSPKGLTNTLSEGIVSGHREIRLGLRAIQTTAAISPGSSGGPLLMADGKVAGVTTLFLTGGQNLNFAVPADRVAKLIASRGGPRTFASVREADARTPLPLGPTEPDPLGFVGTWTEYWPGVAAHDTNVVTYLKGQYSVQGRNPQSGPYRIDNVRLDGNALKFTEHTGPGIAIDYEVRVQNPTTCAVRTFGGPNPGGGILWMRDTTVPLPPGPNDLVATLKWQTVGTDVDLLVFGPNKAIYQAIQDCRSGPGEEACIVRNPAPGDYRIIALYVDSKGGQQTKVTVDARIGDKVFDTCEVILVQDRDSKVVNSIHVPPRIEP